MKLLTLLKVENVVGKTKYRTVKTSTVVNRETIRIRQVFFEIVFLSIITKEKRPIKRSTIPKAAV